MWRLSYKRWGYSDARLLVRWRQVSVYLISTSDLKSALFLCFILVAQLCIAQSALDTRLSNDDRGKSLTEVLDSIERTCKCRFHYRSGWINNITLSDSIGNETLRDELDKILPSAGLNYVEIYPHSIVIVKDPTLMILREHAIGEAKREQRKVLQRRFGTPANSIRKNSVTISGTVVDSKNNHPVIGATVMLSDSTINTTTDVEGKYRLTMRPGEYVMTINLVNYDEATIDLSAYDNGIINIELEEAPKVLEEIVIQDRAERDITTNRIGQVQVSIADIKRAPSILGEADLVKSVQTLPGVTTVGEAAAGFNVRGGSVDQNLVLYDGMPVFNSAHAFGFLSSFNPQAVRSVSFYRAGIPAEFGGRGW
jgi:hypothetical protein